MNDRLMEKLRKILALTTSPEEGEAQAAAAMLARMLEAYNLDIADLEKRGAAQRPDIEQRGHDLGKAAFKWKLVLAEQIAEHYYCYALVDSRSKTVAFIGRPDNVESLQMLYAWLIDQVKRIARVERRHHYIRTGEHIDPLRWQVGFGEGAAQRLGERLREIRTSQQSEAGSALILSHRSEVSDYLERNHGYRIDGKTTARQQEAEERWREWDEQRERERERLQALRIADIEAYYRECPWDTPAEQERRNREEERARKKEERNARRRRGFGRAIRWETEEQRRRREQQHAARQRGAETADQINLQPFLTGGTEARAIAAQARPKSIASGNGG